MPVGMAPLIPLNRLQPDSNARFQRFGQNDSQLFGKPLDLVPQPQVSQLQKVTPRKPALPVEPQAGPKSERRLAVDEPRPSPFAPSELAPAYLGRAGSPSGTGPTPKLGSNLDLKA
jgi:hypothetical protein